VGVLAALTEAAYRDWLKIPVMDDVRLRGMPASDRAAHIDEAFEGSRRGSQRWEHWTGWTAWRPGLLTR
jgi:hypothetical protein